MISTTKIIIIIISGIILLCYSRLDTIHVKRNYPNIAIDLTTKVYRYKMSWKHNTIGGYEKNGNKSDL